MTTIDLDKLKFVKLSNKHDGHVSQFDCSQPDLNEFVQEDALKEQSDRLGVTRLICYDNLLVGYFTLANASIITKNIDDSDYANLRYYPSYPALLIARFAVHKDYQGKGIGVKMLGRSMSIADKLSDHVGCRFITVDAKANIKTIRFYSRFGFKPLKKKQGMVDDILREEYRGNEESVFMYFDMVKPYAVTR